MFILLRPVWFGMIDDLNLLYRAVAKQQAGGPGQLSSSLAAQIESRSASKPVSPPTHQIKFDQIFCHLSRHRY